MSLPASSPALCYHLFSTGIYTRRSPTYCDTANSLVFCYSGCQLASILAVTCMQYKGSGGPQVLLITEKTDTMVEGYYLESSLILSNNAAYLSARPRRSKPRFIKEKHNIQARFNSRIPIFDYHVSQNSPHTYNLPRNVLMMTPLTNSRLLR